MTKHGKINRTAVASLVLGLLVLIPFLPATLAVILGIVARRRINRSDGRYAGKGLATAGIILGSLQGVFWISVTLFSSFFTVQSHEVAIITQFGRIVGEPINPGLNIKIPFIQRAHIIPVKVYFEWQSKPLKCETVDGKRVTVRAKMRYRICDPVKYFITIGSAEKTLAASTLDRIFYNDIMIVANELPLNKFISSVQNLSLQKDIHSYLNMKLNFFGICMHEVDEPYEVLETSS